ncbi:MAG: hypothetical protein R6U98_16530 [Pirellulaceae bacterium]
MESCPTQAVLPLVGLAAEKVIRDRYILHATGNGKRKWGCGVCRAVAVHGCRYTAWRRKARMDAPGLSRGGLRAPLKNRSVPLLFAVGSVERNGARDKPAAFAP